MTGTVQRFTTEYIANEDRMLMSLEFQDGSVQMLWLTRRLLDRLILRLLQYVDDASLPGGGAKNDPVKANVQQRFNQQAATASMRRQKPVRSTGLAQKEAKPPTLVSHVNLRRHDRVLDVEFRSIETALLLMPFRKGELRQWLGVLYNNYQRAEWNGAFWPDWIKPGDAATEANTRLVN